MHSEGKKQLSVQFHSHGCPEYRALFQEENWFFRLYPNLNICPRAARERAHPRGAEPRQLRGLLRHLGLCRLRLLGKGGRKNISPPPELNASLKIAGTDFDFWAFVVYAFSRGGSLDRKNPEKKIYLLVN